MWDGRSSQGVRKEECLQTAGYILTGNTAVLVGEHGCLETAGESTALKERPGRFHERKTERNVLRRRLSKRDICLQDPVPEGKGSLGLSEEKASVLRACYDERS